MLFNSIAFLIFLPIVVLVYFLLPLKGRWWFLLAASCYFYMVLIPKYILILLLQMPFYRFDGEDEAALFANVRQIIEDAQRDGVVALDLPVPNEPIRYVDESHFSPYEREEYTRQLAGYLRNAGGTSPAADTAQSGARQLYPK